jgi:signal peptidase II
VDKNNSTLAAVVSAVIILDQLTKLWIMKALPLYSQKIILPGFFNIVHVTNTGAAFGILAGEKAMWRQFFFITIAVIALVVICVAYRQIKSKGFLFVTAIGLIAGGAIGNLIDRLRFGAVVDFLDFYLHTYHWPAFNVADSAISVGVGLFIFGSILRPNEAGGSG